MTLKLDDQRFGKLVAVRVIGSHPYAGKIWECICDCGVKTEAYARQLNSGKVVSCGCRKLEASHENGRLRRRHGYSRHQDRTYQSWVSMRQRCRDRRNPIYGGRNIQICQRWEKFESFLADMGERPDGMTLDRINGNGNYEPTNCRWATPVVQARNRRSSMTIQYEGNVVSLAQLVELTGLSRHVLRYRLKKSSNPTVWVNGAGSAV